MGENNSYIAKRFTFSEKLCGKWIRCFSKLEKHAIDQDKARSERYQSEGKDGLKHKGKIRNKSSVP